MFLLPERAQPASQVHELPVESRQLSGALRFGSQSGHVGRSADSCWAQSSSGALVSIDTEVLPSRIQLAPHARRRAVPKTVSGWIPVVRLTSNEEWTYRDNDCIYSEYALSEENPMDCIMHYLLGDNIIS